MGLRKSSNIWGIAVAGIVIATMPAAEAGNAANGANVFARCAICHSGTKGDGNKIGPNLFGVVGRKAGTATDFYYSAAMKSAGFTWDNDKLDAYIASPQKVVPGNKMAFAGIASAGQRADLIAYLDTLK